MIIEITDPDKIWEMRLTLGDLGDGTGTDQYLSDEQYQFFINKYTDTTTGTFYQRKALLAAAMAILPILARNGARQRVGQEEIYGKELLDSWLAFIKLLQSPKYNGAAAPFVYFGGVYRDTVAFYETNPEFVDSPFYNGKSEEAPSWKYCRQFINNQVIEPAEQRDNGISTFTQE